MNCEVLILAQGLVAQADARLVSFMIKQLYRYDMRPYSMHQRVEVLEDIHGDSDVCGI